MKTYISIGPQCKPRIYIKNVLNMSKKSGYKTCPFDLCVTNIDSIYECLSTNFENFFEDLHLIYADERAVGNNREGNYIKNKYGFIFNHEGSILSHLFFEGKNDDDFYIRNDYYEFKKRYNSRISNFLETLDKNNEIVLLYYPETEDEKKANIGKIIDLLSKKYPSKKFSTIIIDNMYPNVEKKLRFIGGRFRLI